MLTDLIRKEILEHLLSLRFGILCIVCFVVILSSVAVLSKDYKDELADYHTNLVMHRNEVLAYGNQWQLIEEGLKVDRPLNVMRIFFRGVDRSNTTTVRVRPRQQPEFAGEHTGNPVVPLFPPMDLVFFVGTVMSLLAIAFSYDAVSGEKEQGTLRLLLSFSVPKDLVLLAKWIGGYLALMVPFLLAVLSGLVVVIAFPGVHLTPADWGALALILVVSALYVSAIYSLGILVSTRTRMASTSVTVLLLVWVLLVLVIPNVVPHVAGQISPTPSIQSVEKQKLRVSVDGEQRFVKDMRAWYADNPRPADAIGCYSEVACHQLGQDASLREAAAQEKINDHFRKRMGEQVGLAKLLSRVSPLSSMVYAVGHLSATGMEERNRFLAAVDRYQRQIIPYAFGKAIAVSEEGGEGLDTSDCPKFLFEPSPLADRVRAVFMDFLMLAIWNLVFFMAAYLSFLGYDVR